MRVDFDDSEGSRTLEEELSTYPVCMSDDAPDLIFEHLPLERLAANRTAMATPRTTEAGNPVTLHNPHSHVENENGFTAHFTMASVHYSFEQTELRRIRFYANASEHALVRHARRLVDIQFTSREERSGVIFHELALFPAMYFLRDRALIHASALQGNDEAIVLIGGTGGVGKTSLELHLGLHADYRFVADDVCAVDSDGRVWPSLAYPKIYAYNLVDDDSLRQRVLGSRGVMDRMHWMIRGRLGPSKVRRRVSPAALYDRISTEGGPLGTYAVLVRQSVPDVRSEVIDPARAARMSAAVLETEFAQFNNHLSWHCFNRMALGEEPVTTLGEVTARWRALFEHAFARAQCRLIRIPMRMDHAEFKSTVGALLSSGSNSV